MRLWCTTCLRHLAVKFISFPLLVYQSLESTSPSRVDVWTGKDLTSLTKLGTVITDDTDPGVWYSFRDDLVHIYAEDGDFQSGVSSGKISHWTTPSNDLLNATEQSTAIDVTDRPYKLGDADLVRFRGRYWMFIDKTNDHPNYDTMVWVSDDLYNWEEYQESITSNFGTGDLSVVKVGQNRFRGCSEFTGGSSGQGKLGFWDLFFNDRYIK